MPAVRLKNGMVLEVTQSQYQKLVAAFMNDYSKPIILNGKTFKVTDLEFRPSAIDRLRAKGYDVGWYDKSKKKY